MPRMNSIHPPPAAPPTTGNYVSAPQVAGVPGTPARRSSWVVVFSIIAGVVLLIVLFVAGLLFFLFSAMKSSDPYQHAIQVVSHDPRAVAALGAPINPSCYFSGNINIAGSSGNADVAVPVYGSRNKGTVYVVARKSAGRWSYQTLELEVNGHEDRIDLLPQTTIQPSER
jgi:hypothetical protein